MISALFLTVYSSVMVLSLFFPAQIHMFLTLSVILVSAEYLLHVCVPFLFADAAWIIDYRLAFIPIPVLIAVAVFLPQKTLLLWSLYALTVVIGCLVPLLRCLYVRLTLYTERNGGRHGERVNGYNVASLKTVLEVLKKAV